MSCGPVAIIIGETPPALAVSWGQPQGEWDSGFVVSMSEHHDPDDEDLPAQLLCLHCLLEDADEQLGQGLDLAKRHGVVEWDREAGEWFVPDSESHAA